MAVVTVDSTVIVFTGAELPAVVHHIPPSALRTSQTTLQIKHNSDRQFITTLLLILPARLALASRASQLTFVA